MKIIGHASGILAAVMGLVAFNISSSHSDLAFKLLVIAVSFLGIGTGMRLNSLEDRQQL